MRSFTRDLDSMYSDLFSVFPEIMIFLVILCIVVIALNIFIRKKDNAMPLQVRKAKILEKNATATVDWYLVEFDNGERTKLRNFKKNQLFLSVGDEGLLGYRGLTIKSFQPNKW